MRFIRLVRRFRILVSVSHGTCRHNVCRKEKKDSSVCHDMVSNQTLSSAHFAKHTHTHTHTQGHSFKNEVTNGMSTSFCDLIGWIILSKTSIQNVIFLYNTYTHFIASVAAVQLLDLNELMEIGSEAMDSPTVLI